jgi:hypothetical protein
MNYNTRGRFISDDEGGRGASLVAEVSILSSLWSTSAHLGVIEGSELHARYSGGRPEVVDHLR